MMNCLALRKASSYFTTVVFGVRGDSSVVVGWMLLLSKNPGGKYFAFYKFRSLISLTPRWRRVIGRPETGTAVGLNNFCEFSF